MFFHQPTTDLDPILALGAVAAGTTDTQTFTEVSMSQQYNGVFFLALIGTITATGTATLQAKGSNTSGTYGAGTIGLFQHVDSGNTVQAQATTGDSATLLFIDIFKPLVSYVRGQIVRATANVVITGAVAFRYASIVGAVVPSGVATHSTLTSTPGYDRASNPSLSTS